MLSRPPSESEDADNRLPHIEYNVLLYEFPTVVETKEAIQHLSSGKAPGAYAIPAKIYKAGELPDQKQNQHKNSLNAKMTIPHQGLADRD